MLKQLVKTYYRLLDEKLENGTMVVILIAGLIISASLITKDTNALLYTKSNILEMEQQAQLKKNIVTIDGIQYSITLEQTKK